MALHETKQDEFQLLLYQKVGDCAGYPIIAFSMAKAFVPWLIAVTCSVASASFPLPTYPRYIGSQLNTILNNVLGIVDDVVVTLDGSSGEKWLYDTESQQLVTASHKCLELCANKLQLAFCVNANADQKWYIDGAENRIKHAIHSSTCLEVQGKAVQAANCSSNGENPYQYIFLSEENVAFSINCTKILSVQDNLVVLVDRPHQDRRLVPSWNFHKVNGTLQSNENGLCLQASIDNALGVAPCTSQPAQLWWYEASTKELTHTSTPGLCLTADADSVRLEPCKNLLTQVFIYEMIDTYNPVVSA